MFTTKKQIETLQNKIETLSSQVGKLLEQAKPKTKKKYTLLFDDGKKDQIIIGYSIRVNYGYWYIKDENDNTIAMIAGVKGFKTEEIKAAKSV